jgi:hypothetical protein
LASSRSSAFVNQASKLFGSAGFTFEGVGRGPVAIWAKIIATPWSTFHTVRPTSISYTMQPSAHRSERNPIGPRALACSGLM